MCSQCIDRRFAILAAGMEDNEPGQNYMRDLLTDDRSAGDDLRMALSYVSFFKKIGGTSRERFLVDFPEIVSALGYFPDLTTEQAGTRLYDLFQRHATAVESVITEGMTKHARALFRNELPDGCLLSVCFSRGHVESVPPSDYDAQTKALIDRLATPVLEFAIDTRESRVLFRGGVFLEGANFRVVDALLKNFRTAKAGAADVAYQPAPKLADQLKISDQTLRQQLRRLRDAIEPLAVILGIPMDVGTFIETKERAGYRLNPSLREISVADIKTDHPPPTRP